MSLLSRELMDAIRRIELHTARSVNNRLAGSYQSVFKGQGVVFSEVRKYQPGDDVGAIDWNVSARMNEPHIKLFVEDRDHTVLFVVDMSASGLFGSRARTKREVAAEVTAVLAFSAIKNNDRVGLLLLTDRVECVIPPRKGRRHALRLIRDILAYAPQARGTSLAAGLEYVRKLARHRSLVFLISDFLDTGWEIPLRITHRRHDVVPVVITDPMEAALPDLGIVTVEDLESGQLLEFDTRGPEAVQYANAMAAATTQRERWFKRCGIDAIDIRTDEPYIHAVVEFFRARAHRMRRA